MTSTNANIVGELKKSPDSVGILGTILDARIIHLDLFTVLAVARTYGNKRLHQLMRDKGMSVTPDKDVNNRVVNSQRGTLISGGSLATRRRGLKPRGNTMDAFVKLAEIAQTNDGLLNDSIGRALRGAQLVDKYRTEETVTSANLVYLSDIYCQIAGTPIRLEVMWRKSTGRAEISNYVLTKLRNYGKAIGLLS